MRIRFIKLHFWPQDSDWTLALFNAPDDIEDRIRAIVDTHEYVEDETAVVSEVEDYLHSIGVGYLLPEIDVIEIEN